MSISIREATLKYDNFDTNLFHDIRTFLNGEVKYLYNKVLLELDFKIGYTELENALDLEEEEGIEVPLETYNKSYISRDNYFYYDSNKLKNSLTQQYIKVNKYYTLTPNQKNIMRRAIDNCNLSLFYSQYNRECYVIAGW